MGGDVQKPRPLLNVNIVCHFVPAYSPHCDLWTLHGDCELLMFGLLTLNVGVTFTVHTEVHRPSCKQR